MNELKIFSNTEFGSVRTTDINGEIYFVGKDVAEALGYGDTTQAIRKHVDDEDRLTSRFDGSGQMREMAVINESGLYSLVLSSKLPSAKKFKRWITAEVIPSIRKNGAYLTDEKAIDLVANPQNLIGLLEQAVNQLKEKDIRIEQMRPKEIFADAVTASDTAILMRDLAKMLKQNGVDTGEKRLYKWMRENGYIIKNSKMPTQKAMELGLFVIVETSILGADSEPIVRMTTKVTGKGQQYFLNKFLGGTHD